MDKAELKALWTLRLRGLAAVNARVAEESAVVSEDMDQSTVKQVWMRQRAALQRVEQLQFARAIEADAASRLMETLALSSLYLRAAANRQLTPAEHIDAELSRRWGRLVEAAKEQLPA